MSLLRMSLAAALTLMPTVAFADALSVFEVQGTLYYGYSLSGTLTLDTTTGMFSDASLEFYKAGGTDDFFVAPDTQSFLNGGYFLQFFDFTNRGENILNSVLYLTLPTIPSAGQTLQICSVDTPCVVPEYAVDFESYAVSVYGDFGQYRMNYGLITGQLTPLATTAVTPEPSSFLLLGTGLIALGGAFRAGWRKR